MYIVQWPLSINIKVQCYNTLLNVPTVIVTSLLNLDNYIIFHGYTTLRRTTLRLLSHFVEKAFCLSVILSNVHLVETGFRRTLSMKYFMLTWPPYYIC